jgi:ribose/xylose/arabinose/galactoside ABC-type transport system permease subunit
MAGFRLENFVLLFVLLGLSVMFSFLSPYFLSWINIFNVLLSVSVIGVMAAVSTLVIVGRGLDLSIGSMTALLGVAAGVLVETLGWPWYTGVAATLVLGAFCGSLNGIVIAWLRIDPIITTIGMLSVFRGVGYMITDGQTLSVQSEELLFVGSGRIFGIPFSVWLLAAVILLAHFVATRTRIGRSVYAVGANPQAALVAGLNVALIRFWLMVASGVSAALAALLLVGQSGAATPSAAIGYELLVITAVLLGGTSLAGGKGSVLRTALGVMIIGVLNNGMVLMSVPTFYQISAHGLLMLAAVILDRVRTNRTASLE